MHTTSQTSWRYKKTKGFPKKFKPARLVRSTLDCEALPRFRSESAARYPSLLRETFDPPIVLYALGDIERALAQPAIAVVGSRSCSTYGRNVAEMLARELAERGITIISGLARGIDSAAHQGALAGRGLTIAGNRP